MDKLKIKLAGESPLLMHSDRGANPLDPETKRHKALTSKRKKTDEDHEAIARSEWKLSLYHDKKLGPYLPTTNIRSAIVNGGKINKLGSAIQKGTLILADRAAVNYKGPRDPDELWDSQAYTDCRSVVVGQSRLMRYRPVFETWSLEFELLYDTTVLDREQIEQALGNAGRLIGLGDYRPECGGPFGRFLAEVAS